LLNNLVKNFPVLSSFDFPWKTDLFSIQPELRRRIYMKISSFKNIKYSNLENFHDPKFQHLLKIKDETVKTTWNSLNITIQRLNSVFCIEYCFCGLSYDFEKKETHLQLHRTGPNWKETDGINSAQSSVKSHPFWITLYVKFKRNSRLDNSRTSYILYLFGAYMQSAVLLLMYNGSVHEGNWI